MKKYKLLNSLIFTLSLMVPTFNVMAGQKIYCPEQVSCQGSSFSDCQNVPATVQDYVWYPQLAFHINQGAYFFRNAQVNVGGQAYCLYCKELDKDCRQAYVVYHLINGSLGWSMAPDTEFLLADGSFAWSAPSGICSGAEVGHGASNPLNCPIESGR